jgi:hypothetical protein
VPLEIDPTATVSSTRSRARRTLTLGEVAKDELEKADGDIALATANMQVRVFNDETLYRQVVHTACQAAVLNEVRQTRSTIWNPPPPPTTETVRSRVAALAAGTRQSLFNFPLWDGQKLGDATRDEILATAQNYRSRAQDMYGKSRWLEMIAAAMPAGVVAKRVFTEAKLQALKIKAEREAV